MTAETISGYICFYGTSAEILVGLCWLAVLAIRHHRHMHSIPRAVARVKS